MSISTVLSELVAGVDGATGAILLEIDGEAVQWSPEDGGERLRLRGAYIAVVVKSFRSTGICTNPLELVCLTLKYAGSSFIAQEINRDCLLVLEMEPDANAGQAAFRMRSAIEKLRVEIE